MSPKRIHRHFGTVMGVAVVAIVTASGCGSSPASPPVAVDKDGDHFTEAQGDCNDANAAVNPDGVVVVEACRWTTAQWDCPRGSNRYTEDQDVILVRVINNKCSTLTITSAAVETTVQEADGTFNRVGETWTTEKLAVSPTSVPAGVGATSGSTSTTSARIPREAAHTTCTRPR